MSVGFMNRSVVMRPLSMMTLTSRNRPCRPFGGKLNFRMHIFRILECIFLEF